MWRPTPPTRFSLPPPRRPGAPPFYRPVAWAPAGWTNAFPRVVEGRPAGVVHSVRLVDHAEPAAGQPEALGQDAADAVVRVDVLLDRDLVLGAAAEAAAHAHVEPLGVLAHDHQVDAAPLRIPQRAQAVVVEAGRPPGGREGRLAAETPEDL